MATLVMKHSLLGKTALNVWELGVDSDPNNPPITDLGAALETLCDSYETFVMEQMSNRLTFLGCELQGPSPIEVGRSYTGQINQDALPPNVAVIVQKNVTSGRRGRLFVAGVSDEWVDGGGIVQSARAAVITSAFNLWLSDVDAANLQLQVKRADDSVAGITSFACGTLVGTQKDRLGR